ncbi:MAG: hypothetical protein ABJA66_01610 [Actinomycetota bacterium]
MKRLMILCGLAILFCVCVCEIQAEILEAGEEKIDFSPGKIQKNVTWSDSFSLQETGLETKQLPKNQVRDVWLQTHSFPIGLSWRPPNSANFTVSLDGSIDEVDSTYRLEPQIFIRYSCDKVNWSTWYIFSKSDKKTDKGLNIYENKIWLPTSVSEKYQNLMRDWWKTNPLWSSDENEFCEWLVKKEPDFFAKELPFIGYVQLRMEKMAVNPSQNLKSLTIRYFWSVGGLASIPKDKSKVRKNTEDKWFFEGKSK